ncbi:hypothetical protein TNCV_1943181 [Trichonephila clavipes]|nr:hypothetical protein TNCV_1943181 [Trichonephila clavipes]
MGICDLFIEKEDETDQAIEEPDEIMHINRDSEKELLPVLGEFVGVVSGPQLVFLERPKRALLDSCLENTLVIPFVRFLPRKGNPPRG